MNPFREHLPLEDNSIPVRVFINSSGETHMQVHPHWHEEIEILYYLKGHARQQVGCNVFEAAKGDIIIIGSSEIHSTYATLRDYTEILVIQFSTSLFSPYLYRYPERQSAGSKGKYINYPVPITANDKENNEFEEYLKNITREFNDHLTAHEYYLKSLIYNLTGALARRYGCIENVFLQESGHNRFKDILKDIFNYIDDNYHEDLKLEQASKVVNLSTAHFCRLFMKFTGMTFKDYLTLYRINRAEELLYTLASITEIAQVCGFNSITSFNRAFKKYKNMTPSDYRKKL